MIEGLEPALTAAGVPPDRIHVERFTPSSDAALPPVVVPEGTPPPAIATLIIDGARFAVPMSEGETIVDAALRAGRDPPFSCRAGMCCTCRARLLQGRGGDGGELLAGAMGDRSGYVLTCQARPLTRQVVVDYDQV
jgi:ring-1,2-phenylacetyl-CoA epoxidase subunit PaaE